MIAFVDETGMMSEPRLGDAFIAELFNADLREQDLLSHGKWIVLTDADFPDAKDFQL